MPNGSQTEDPSPSLAALKADDSTFRRFIENLPAMFYAVTPTAPHRPIFISQEFERFGYPIEDWLTKPDIWDIVTHPEDREDVLGNTREALKKGESTDFVYRVVCKDGSVAWIRDRGCFIRDANGTPVCWQGVVLDITAQKESSAEITRREKLYRTLARHIPKTAVLLFDHDFRYTLCDGEQLKSHNWTSEMFEGKTLYDIFPHEIASEYEEYYRRALDGESVSFESTSEDGVFEVDVMPIRDETGEIFAGMVMWRDISERKAAEAAVLKSEAKYRELFENANDIIYVHDLEGNYLSINDAAERIFGYTKEEALEMNMAEIAAPGHLDTIREQLAKKVNGGASQTVYEVECLRKDGEHVTLEVNSSIIEHDGVASAVQGIARDVSDRRRAEQALRQSEARFRDLFENANDLIYTHDLNGNFTSLNRAGELITGYSREEALQMNIAEVVAPEYLEEARTMTARKVGKDNVPTTYQLEIIAKDGHRVTLELSTRLIVVDGLPVGVQGLGRDITARLEAEERLRHYALHDTLTDLPNRVAFMNHLRDAVNRAEGNDFARFAVLFLDLDRFKVINDSLGHAVGDKLLIAIAERLKACVRPGDVVARLGGDEFTILLNRSGELNDVTHVAERLQSKISQPFKIDNYEVFTSASIGVVVAGQIDRTAEDFLRDADAAMYRAKESGKARYEVFDREMHVLNMNLLQVETDLRHAVERREFEVLYQPIVDLSSGRVEEFEALIRWRHPVHGLVGPNEFVHVAEETGLIIPIGRWILEEACRQIAKWQQLHNTLLSVSVNLSAKQLMHPSLTHQVKEVLFNAGLESSQLKLEVTESTVMEHSERSQKVLADLDELGVALSTDDFGTGYSSLSYLQKFPFDRLKIDRSFVREMGADEKSALIVRTILMLGDNLGLEVVAEGVENAAQLAQLRSLGCKLGQGFLFARPLSAQDAENVLRDGLSGGESFGSEDADHLPEEQMAAELILA